MEKLTKLSKIVENVLERNPKTREDDFKLIYEVYKSINSNIEYIPLKYIINNHIEMGLPSFESITRCRRKIQETRKDLIDGTTEIIRKDEEQPKYEEFSRS